MPAGLVTGLARQGAEIPAATLAGVCARAGALLVPLGDAITARPRAWWHLHADETSWHVFAPRDGDGPARWRPWAFPGPDTACLVMDPGRAGRCWPGTPASARAGSSRRMRTAGRGGW